MTNSHVGCFFIDFFGWIEYNDLNTNNMALNIYPNSIKTKMKNVMDGVSVVVIVIMIVGLIFN